MDEDPPDESAAVVDMQADGVSPSVATPGVAVVQGHTGSETN